MPYYGFLMHLGNVTLDASVEDALMRITMVGCGLSVMGIMLTIFLVCFLPLRSDSMFIVANIGVSLLCSQTCYLGIENSYPDNTMCKMAAGVLHYFFLCFHCWMLVYGVHLFLKMRLGNRSPNWQRRYMYVLTGWLVPLLIVLICALVNPKGYGMEHICWLSHENGSHWAFVAPVLVIMAVNFMIFIMVLRASWRHDRNRAVPFCQILRHQICTIVSLVPVMGFTWIFGLAPIGPGTVLFQYIFTIINPAQGFLILVAHMIRSGQVRAAWKHRFLQPPSVDQPASPPKEDSVDTNSSDVHIENLKNVAKKG